VRTVYCGDGLLRGGGGGCVWLVCCVCMWCDVLYVAADVLLNGCVLCVYRKDERMRVLGEALYGIRVIKLFAWEDHFDQAISTSDTSLSQSTHTTCAITHVMSLLCSPQAVSNLPFPSPPLPPLCPRCGA
jgi:hypothetical protein